MTLTQTSNSHLLKKKKKDDLGVFHEKDIIKKQKVLLKRREIIEQNKQFKKIMI